MMNKKNNKGFSLVELIVVVAIMAVLVAVLAPAYLKYVENSRVSKDQTNADEFVRAVEIAITDEDIYEDITFATGSTAIKIVITDETAIVDASGAAVGVTGGTCALLMDEVADSVADTLDLTSKTYEGGTLEITIAASDFNVTSALKDSAGNVH